MSYKPYIRASGENISVTQYLRLRRKNTTMHLFTLIKAEYSSNLKDQTLKKIHVNISLAETSSDKLFSLYEKQKHCIT